MTLLSTTATKNILENKNGNLWEKNQLPKCYPAPGILTSSKNCWVLRSINFNSVSSKKFLFRASWFVLISLSSFSIFSKFACKMWKGEGKRTLSNSINECCSRRSTSPRNLHAATDSCCVSSLLWHTVPELSHSLQAAWNFLYLDRLLSTGFMQCSSNHWKPSQTLTQTTMNHAVPTVFDPFKWAFKWNSFQVLSHLTAFGQMHKLNNACESKPNRSEQVERVCQVPARDYG